MCARTGKILVKNWEIFVTVLGIKYVWTSRKVPMARPGRDSHCVSDSDCALWTALAGPGHPCWNGPGHWAGPLILGSSDSAVGFWLNNSHCDLDSTSMQRLCLSQTSMKLSCWLPSVALAVLPPVMILALQLASLSWLSKRQCTMKQGQGFHWHWLSLSWWWSLS